VGADPNTQNTDAHFADLEELAGLTATVVDGDDTEDGYEQETGGFAP
jgi:hypothetical protein